MSGLTAAMEKQEQARQEYVQAITVAAAAKAYADTCCKVLMEATRQADRLRMVSAQMVYEEYETGVRHVVCFMHEEELEGPCWWVGPADADAVCERCVALGFGG